MSYMNEIRIRSVMLCFAIPERIRFIAELDRDISEIMPYLNTVIDGVIYNQSGHSITMKKGDRMIGIQSRQIAAGKVIDLKDADDLIKWFKDLVNDTYEKKDTIAPNYERRKQMTALDVYKLLLRQTVKNVVNLPVLLLQLNLLLRKNVMKCVDLFSGSFNEKRDELIRILKLCDIFVKEVN